MGMYATRTDIVPQRSCEFGRFGFCAPLTLTGSIWAATMHATQRSGFVRMLRLVACGAGRDAPSNHGLFEPRKRILARRAMAIGVGRYLERARRCLTRSLCSKVSLL